MRVMRALRILQRAVKHPTKLVVAVRAVRALKTAVKVLLMTARRAVKILTAAVKVMRRNLQLPLMLAVEKMKARRKEVRRRARNGTVMKQVMMV